MNLKYKSGNLKLRKRKTRGPNGQLLKSTKISKPKSLGTYVGESGVQRALPGSLSSRVVDSVFIQRALFEVDATAIKA